MVTTRPRTQSVNSGPSDQPLCIPHSHPGHASAFRAGRRVAPALKAVTSLPLNMKIRRPALFLSGTHHPPLATTDGMRS